MVNEKLARLLTELRHASTHGKVEWQQTSDENQFRTHIGGGMVRIGQKAEYPYNQERDPVYSATLIGEDGSIADEVEVTRDMGFYRTMAEVYDLARKAARKGNDLLDRMLDDLGRRMASVS